MGRSCSSGPVLPVTRRRSNSPERAWPHPADELGRGGRCFGHYDRGRESPRIPGRHHGSRTDGKHPSASRAVWRGRRLRRRDSARAHWRWEGDHYRFRDHLSCTRGRVDDGFGLPQTLESKASNASPAGASSAVPPAMGSSSAAKTLPSLAAAIPPARRPRSSPAWPAALPSITAEVRLAARRSCKTAGW